MAVSNPHDHFFRQMFGDRSVLVDFFQRYLPQEVLAQIDLASLELHKESYVDEELREHQADLLCQVTQRDGRPAFLYLLLEHKSAPDRWVTLQLLRYKLRIWQRMRTEGADPAPILPLLVYHGVQKWRVPQALHELLKTPDAWRPYVDDYRCLLFDLSQYDDEQLTGGVRLLVALLMLKHIFQADLESVLVRVVRLLWRELDQQIAVTQLQVVFRYAASGANVGQEQARRVFEQAIEQGGEVMASWVDEIFQEGREEGREEGLDEGTLRQLLRVLRHRYPDLPATLPEQIARLTVMQKELLIDIALETDSLNTFLEEFKACIDTGQDQST